MKVGGGEKVQSKWKTVDDDYQGTSHFGNSIHAMQVSDDGKIFEKLYEPLRTVKRGDGTSD